MSAVERASGLTLVAFALGLIAVGCGDTSEPTPKSPLTVESPSAPSQAQSPSQSPPQPPPESAPDAAGSAEPQHAESKADAEAGNADYQIYCASCHGQSGGGDGPVAAALPVKPAKHNDGGYMNALSDDYLFKVIAEGGPAVGKSEMMAPWGGSLSDAKIRNIIAFIRSLADPPYTQ